MSLELAIEELEKLVGDEQIGENLSNNVISEPTEFLACLELSFRKLQKAITRAERCGHSVQHLVVSSRTSCYFKCDQCDKNTFVENNVLKTKIHLSIHGKVI